MTTSWTGPRKVPACVYLLFHAESSECLNLANEVFDWLRFSKQGSVTGIPVYYRALVPNGAVTPPIDWKGAEHNFIVPLVDARMAVDGQWRSALKLEAAKASANWHVLPVMVDKSFDQLTFLAAKFNPIRIYDREDGDGATDEKKAVYFDRRAKRLRRRLTEEMVRALRKPRDERLKIFVSHAKIDGEHIARHVRDGLASVSQLEAWFDVNDLVSGRAAEPIMADAARNTSGGMIAVVTDAYPTRPWCRYEARLARTPRRVGTKQGPHVFAAQPTIALQVNRGTWSRSVGPLAQIYRIGWLEDLPLSERITELVDRLLLEILMTTFNRMLMTSLKEPEDIKGSFYLAFVPDAWSLAELKLASPRRKPPAIVYPGHRLRTVEHLELERVVEATFGRDVKLTSLEALQVPRLPASTKPWIVGLSMGGENVDLFAAGLGKKHVRDFMTRLSRELLTAGQRIAFGGRFKHNDNLTEALLDIGDGWRNDTAFELGEKEEQLIEANDKRLAAPPIINFSAWPHSKKVTPQKRADYLGLCEFVVVLPDEDTYENRIAWAAREDHYGTEAQRRIRELMPKTVDVHVFFGGRVYDYDGFLPGIAHELMCLLETPNHYILLGGLGGCGELLARYLESDVWPDELTYEHELDRKRKNGTAKSWLDTIPEPERQKWYADLRASLTKERAAIMRLAAGEHHRGLTKSEWTTMFESKLSATQALSETLSWIAKLQRNESSTSRVGA